MTNLRSNRHFAAIQVARHIAPQVQLQPQRQGSFGGSSFKTVPHPPAPAPRGGKLAQAPSPSRSAAKSFAGAAALLDAGGGASPSAIAAVDRSNEDGSGQRDGDSGSGGRGEGDREERERRHAGAAGLVRQRPLSTTLADAARALEFVVGPARARVQAAAARGDAEAAAAALVAALFAAAQGAASSGGASVTAMQAGVMAAYLQIAPPRSSLARLAGIKQALLQSGARGGSALLPLKLLMCECPRKPVQRCTAVERLQTLSRFPTDLRAKAAR